MKNNPVAGTELLYSESFKYGGNAVKNMMEIVKKRRDGKERPSRWDKGIICALLRKGEKILYGLLYILMLNKHCPESYNIDIEIMLKLRLENTTVWYIKAYQL